MKNTAIIAAFAAAAALQGCIQVKTESEIKPIHITMDVNLKVDKDLDKAFSENSSSGSKGDYQTVKDLLYRKAAGVDSKAMLVARDGASDEDRLKIADANASRMRRFSEIAKSNGTTMEQVQRRHAEKMRERIAAGSGVWYQAEDGSWRQK